ncbi:MAG: ribonuclease P protein component [Sulfuricellaceae bacterium]|nr:ribonuclease P protein component [Sulfuricellaceae bacterium]
MAVLLYGRVVPRAVIVSASEHKASFCFEQRLHRPEEYSSVMATRRVVRGECFDLHYSQAVGDRKARLGLIVPKRLARAASLRNAIKRQGREAFRLMAIEMRPRDLVLRLKRPFVGAKAGDSAQRKVWRTEIEILLRRLPSQSQ